MTFRILAIPSAHADLLRARRADDFGNRDLTPIRADASPGYPCRHCLRDAAVGDALLLASYSPFAAATPYRTVGPIFLHADACPAAPASDAVPAMLRVRPLAVRAYDERDRIVDAELTEGVDLEAAIARRFDDPRARYLLVHFARYGCYACRVERG